MARYVNHLWEPNYDGMTKAERIGGSYLVYEPDKLAGRQFLLDGEACCILSEAERALQQFDLNATSLKSTEALARLLLRAEALSSSKIEGLSIGARRLLRTEVGSEHPDARAVSVMNNIDAMERALSQGAAAPLTVDTLCEIHRELMKNTEMADIGGQIRTRQNWLGGNDFTPIGAEYVPPVPESVPGLLEDLVVFCNSETMTPLSQAAIAHAQFETIHPFADGNGRVGRALMHIILKRRGLCVQAAPPISLSIATRPKDYERALAEFRHAGDATSLEAQNGVNSLVLFFAECASISVRDATRFEEQTQDIKTAWIAKLAGKVTPGEAAVMDAICGTPIFTAGRMVSITGRSAPTVNAAIASLQEAGIVKQINAGKRNRAFEAPDIVAAFTGLERRLASPEGDTKMAAPVRAVPNLPEQGRPV